MSGARDRGVGGGTEGAELEQLRKETETFFNEQASRLYGRLWRRLEATYREVGGDFEGELDAVLRLLLREAQVRGWGQRCGDREGEHGIGRRSEVTRRGLAGEFEVLSVRGVPQVVKGTGLLIIDQRDWLELTVGQFLAPAARRGGERGPPAAVDYLLLGRRPSPGDGEAAWAAANELESFKRALVRTRQHLEELAEKVSSLLKTLKTIQLVLGLRLPSPADREHIHVRGGCLQLTGWGLQGEGIELGKLLELEGAGTGEAERYGARLEETLREKYPFLKLRSASAAKRVDPPGPEVRLEEVFPSARMRRRPGIRVAAGLVLLGLAVILSVLLADKWRFWQAERANQASSERRELGTKIARGEDKTARSRRDGSRAGAEGKARPAASPSRKETQLEGELIEAWQNLEAERARRTREAELHRLERARLVSENRDYRSRLRDLATAVMLDDLEREAQGILKRRESRSQAEVDGWFRRADELQRRLPRYRALYVRWLARVLPEASRAEVLRLEEALQGPNPRWPPEMKDQLRRVEQRHAAEIDAADPGWRWQIQVMRGLVRRLEDLRTEEGVFRRMEALRQRLSFLAGQWTEAAAAIRDRRRCPAYQGLEVPRRDDLLPLRYDETRGIYEFLHLPDGRIPASLAAAEATSVERRVITFVLLPGGTVRFQFVARREEDDLEPGGSSVMAVAVEPFYVGKTELTRGQWARLCEVAGRASEVVVAGPPGRDESHLYPVEGVSWWACVELLQKFDMTLPTEVQWEYAAKGGSDSPWWAGSQEQELEEVGNVADRAWAQAGAGRTARVPWDDGFAGAAPVARFRANRFGLFDVAGNVAEWCWTDFHIRPKAVVMRQDPASEQAGDGGAIRKVVRGGAWYDGPSGCRSVSRDACDAARGKEGVGCRPVLLLSGSRTEKHRRSEDLGDSSKK